MDELIMSCSQRRIGPMNLGNYGIYSSLINVLINSYFIYFIHSLKVGVGIIPASPVFSISRNPNISNTSIRRSFIGSSLVEVPGFTGSVYSPLIPYAFIKLPNTSLVFSTHHCYIGLYHIMSGLIGGSVGYGLPTIIRLELALPGFPIRSSPQYNTRITFHGLFTTSSMIMPILIGGFGNIPLPLPPRPSDMIFPRTLSIIKALY